MAVYIIIYTITDMKIYTKFIVFIVFREYIFYTMKNHLSSFELWKSNSYKIIVHSRVL